MEIAFIYSIGVVFTFAVSEEVDRSGFSYLEILISSLFWPYSLGRVLGQVINEVIDDKD